ncbi:mediator complex subunit 13 C-terminal-domain-containing protein [Paraphoma chrysanthemicola]|nr:mediator complex subunit 13 C-terminal-domain-containing protein [Paraphoma chrysanthemicola]
MEFLKTCSTNAQAIGEYEAIAYQAFSLARDASHPTSPTPDWSSSDDVRAVEAQLRQLHQLVTQDASRPWLWHFEPIALDAFGQDTIKLPVVEGFSLQREQFGFMKASEMARPPMRPGNPQTFSHPATSPSTPGPHKGAPTATTRPIQTGQSHADQTQALDCFTVYELFVSSITALVSYSLVKKCGVVALNYRTFVAKPLGGDQAARSSSDVYADVHWLTSINIHWLSSGTVLVSTYTDQADIFQCLDSLDLDSQKSLVGSCIRLAPNGMLARISSFEDPLEASTEDLVRRVPRKKARVESLEQNIERWKVSVERMLKWKGYSVPNLNDKSSWVRIRTAHTTSISMTSPPSSHSDRDVLWPRALCFTYRSRPTSGAVTESNGPQPLSPPPDDMSWFEAAGSIGFRDPIDNAQEWYIGKLERDRVIEGRRRSKKAEEDAMRRKEEPAGLYPSSPFNARSGVYGELQAVSGVYPTPPDGIAPGTGLSTIDTPSVSGAAPNVILPPGGSNPAINLSAPQDHPQSDEQQHPSTSPLFPTNLDPFQSAGDNDDLFEDAEGDAFGGNGVNEADFDFFDEPDEPSAQDTAMPDAPGMSQTGPNQELKHGKDAAILVPSEMPIKEEMSDPTAALEDALANSTQSVGDTTRDVKDKEAQDHSASSTDVPAEPIPSKKPIVNAHVDEPQAKAPTPPLSPSIVADALLPSPPGKRISQRRAVPNIASSAESAFHSLDFSRRLSLADAKYHGGRFAAHLEKDVNHDKSAGNAAPARIKSLRDLPLLTNLRYAMGVASANQTPQILSLARAVSDESDLESDSEDASESSDVSDEDVEIAAKAGPTPFLGRLIIPAKRKLPTEGHATPLSVTSFAESFGGDWQESMGLVLDEASLSVFDANSWDWPLLRLPPPTERSLAGSRYAIPSLSSVSTRLPDTPTSQPDVDMDLPDEKPTSGKESIVVTQIVTDQIISATLDVLGEDECADTSILQHSTNETRWQTTMKTLFPKAVDCSVSSLIALHDVFPDLSAQAKGQQRPTPRKPNDSSAIPSNHIYQMHPPFVRVRRAETQWDLLPPSIAFWEPLGLAPVSAQKNIVAFCVYPSSDGLRPVLERFMLNLQLAYDTCKLGTHARVETVIEYEGGLVPCKANPQASKKDAFKALRETCTQLGRLLAIQHSQIREQQDAKVDAFVIYMVNPFKSPSALWELCSAFWTLFQAYGQVPPGRSDQSQKPDLVLQILPIKYLASFDAPIVLDASTYVNLAREVYDRCPPSASSTDKTPLNIYKAPAFQLEESLPRSIQFKLMSEPPQDLLRENSYMHLAYAISLDGTWVTAAWTDSCGKSQAVVSYHLGTRAFGEVAKEIWQTTIDILQSRRVQWRVCIAKVGAMDREELETWVLLITCPTQVNLFLTLLTVAEDSPYKFTPTASTGSSTGQTSNATPGSTPQPGVSPDPAVGLTPAATPSADAPDPSADPDARLIDVTDETWGIILAHRLHNSNCTNQFSPALISGLLVKRGETHATSNSVHHPIPDPEPGPIVVAVNILWIGAVGSTRAATSPFPPSTDGVSPGGVPPSPAAQERSTSSLMWTPTVQTRATAENLLKEVLAHFRGLGLLAKLKGMRGTRHGTLPWHVVAAKRGVEGLGKVTGGT